MENQLLVQLRKKVLSGFVDRCQVVDFYVQKTKVMYIKWLWQLGEPSI